MTLVLLGLLVALGANLLPFSAANYRKAMTMLSIGALMMFAGVLVQLVR